MAQNLFLFLPSVTVASSLYLLMASLCTSSLISLVVPPTEEKREERGMVPAMSGLMLMSVLNKHQGFLLEG